MKTVVTDRAVLKHATINVAVQFKRTYRGRLGFWLFIWSTKFAAWLMNCTIEVKSLESDRGDL